MIDLNSKFKKIFSLIGFSILFSNAHADMLPVETADIIIQRLVSNGYADKPVEAGKNIYKYLIYDAQNEIKGTFAIWINSRSQYITPYTMAVWNGMSHYSDQLLIPAIYYITDIEGTEASGGTNSVTASNVFDANSLTHLPPLVTNISLFNDD